MSSIEEQLHLEELMVSGGIDKYHHTNSKHVQHGQESMTSYGRALVAGVVAKVTEGVEELQAPSVGKDSLAKQVLADMNPEQVAYISLLQAVDSLSTSPRVLKVARSIAERLEDQHRLDCWRGINREYMENTLKKANRIHGSRRNKRGGLINKMENDKVPYIPWSNQERLHTGLRMIDIIIAKTGLFKIYTEQVNRSKRTSYLVPTENTLDWIEKFNSVNEAMSPRYVPSVIPPKDWTGIQKGGFHSSVINQIPFIKLRRKRDFKSIADADFSQEYQAVNALQKTPWQINKPVLDVLKHFWYNDVQIGDMPNREDIPLEPYPFEVEPAEMDDATKKEFKKWKQRRNEQYVANTKNMSKRIAVERCIQIADKYAKRDAFYYVYQCDFRGRKYTVEPYLNPQNTDFSKSLLKFGKGVSIDHADGARWLAIHGANLFGNDKISLKDRELWAYLHSEEAIAVAENPKENLWWTTADEPWQFLAWCFEWAGWSKQGVGFVTYLPTQVDGSCNGLQHFAAMLKDEVAGANVNLTPSVKPQDVYRDVLEETIRVLTNRAEGGCDMAAMVLLHGINRPTVKRPVMIVPYSGTRVAVRAYIQEDLEDKVEKGKWPADLDLFKVSVYLADVVWEAISSRVTSARQAMDWIRDVSKLYSDANIPMTWTTPTGFKVHQFYPNVEVRRIKTHIDNSVVKLSVHDELDTVDTRRSSNGAAPNFVHSMDASALTKTVNECPEIDCWSMVHDSYGTHSPMMELMVDKLRSAFADMYTDHDVLDELYQQTVSLFGTDCVPLPPAKGSLDVQLVKQSDYFFA